MTPIIVLRLLQKTLVKHEINHDAGDRNVKPEAESNPGNLAVLLEIPFQGPAEGNDGEDRHRYGQDGMGGQNEKIKGSHPTLPLVINNACQIMMDQIGNKEHHGNGKSRDHAKAVGLTV